MFHLLSVTKTPRPMSVSTKVFPVNSASIYFCAYFSILKLIESRECTCLINILFDTSKVQGYRQKRRVGGEASKLSPKPLR
jgi:hypothetical protein